MTEEKNKQEKLDGFVSGQIEYQLEQITNSSGFISSTQMQNFLRHIVHKKLSGQESLLKQYTIAVEALGQEEDFDPETNPLVRIEAGRLRKKLREYYQNEGKDDVCIVSIPVGRYIPLFEKNENANNKEHVENRVTKSWKKSLGPRLLVSCFTDKAHSNKSRELLLFVSDNLAQVLSRFLFFRLISAIPHSDRDISTLVIKSYRDHHMVDYALTVNIHHLYGKDYQLICHLVDAESQQVLWSESYALNIDEKDNQQEKVCHKITAATVDLQQGVMQVHWARSLLQQPWETIRDSYKVFAFYRYHFDNFTNDSFAVAVKACKDALINNQDDVVALSIYSEYCRREYIYNHGVIKNSLEEGLQSAQQAVRLMPESHEAHYVLGQMWFHLDNKAMCKWEFEESRRLSHFDSLTTFGTAFHLFMMEEWDEGLQLAQNVMKANPAHPDWFYMLPFLNFYRLGDYDSALLEALRIVSPNVFWGPLARAAAYGKLEQLDKANLELVSLIERYPDLQNTGEQMLQRYFGSEQLFKSICDGLEKAGMEFSCKFNQ